MRVYYLISVFSLVLLLSSCVSPLPLSKLTSESPDSRWVSGRQYLQKESLGIGVNLAYYKNEDNLLIFDAYIENFSKESIEINPTQIELISMDSNKEIISKVKAVDPEEMSTDYD